MSENVGDLCIDCMQSTAWGSGRFINRIPADNGERNGFLCYECYLDGEVHLLEVEATLDMKEEDESDE